jgi:hypothetical protein
VMAQDMFFTPLPANNALEFINLKKNTLPDFYKLELPPTFLPIGLPWPGCTGIWRLPRSAATPCSSCS